MEGGEGEKGVGRRKKAFGCSIQEMIFLFPSIVENTVYKPLAYRFFHTLSLFNLTFQAPKFREFLQVLKLLDDMETILLL